MSSVAFSAKNWPENFIGEPFGALSIISKVHALEFVKPAISPMTSKIAMMHLLVLQLHLILGYVVSDLD